MHNTKIYDIIILGAGTSGLFAGFLLKRANFQSFLILEKNSEAGKKLTIAGGGNGNLTNKEISHLNYIGQDNNFASYALKKFPYKKALDLFYALDIPLEERDFGQIFSTISAKEFRNALAYELPISHDTEISKLSFHNDIFIIESSQGTFQAKKVILSTGSNAYPQLGASDIGIDIARDLGIEAYAFEPCLTPFHLPNSSPLSNLSGISIDVGININNKKIIRPLLFTHTGISGPAVLLLSCYVSTTKKEKILIDFLPNENVLSLCHEPKNGKLLVKNLFSRFFPDRLAAKLIPLELQNKKVAELSKAQRLELEKNINFHSVIDFELAPLSKAEAAKNGVLTKELNNKTMQTIKNENLYIIGEVMDITGQLGGYNIHFALASAYCAIQHILKN